MSQAQAPMYNLLTEPLIRVVLANGEEKSASLPELYTILERNEAAYFPGLRAHQEPMWHAFLVQLGALALIKAGETSPDGHSPEAWRRLIRGLTSNKPDEWPDDEPWCFCTALDKPGFLQYPIESVESDIAYEHLHPDDLDVLVTSRNHDLKQSLACNPTFNDWLFALISVQTQAGYDGRGHVGIARMNGGYGNRTLVRVSSRDCDTCGIFRDLRILLDPKRGLNPDQVGLNSEKVVVTWLEAWDGKAQESITNFHSLTLECARRIRIGLAGERLCAAHFASDKPRFVTKLGDRDVCGVVRDPWLPIEQLDSPKALSVTSEGFSYKVISRVLFGDGRRSYELPVLARITTADHGTLIIHFSGLARGQGKTDGYYSRQVIVSSGSTQLFASSLNTVSSRSQEQIREAAEIHRLFRAAALLIMDENPFIRARSHGTKDSIFSALDSNLDSEIDREFFRHLDNWGRSFSEEVNRLNAEAAWQKYLVGLGRKHLMLVSNSGPQSCERRILNLSKAQSYFEGKVRASFPKAFQTSGSPNAAAT